VRVCVRCYLDSRQNNGNEDIDTEPVRKVGDNFLNKKLDSEGDTVLTIVFHIISYKTLSLEERVWVMVNIL